MPVAATVPIPTPAEAGEAYAAIKRFGSSGSSHRHPVRKARKVFRANIGAQNIEDLRGGASRWLNQLRLYEEIGDTSQAEMLRRRLMKAGVNLDDFEGEGSADQALLRMSRTPRGARSAAFLKNSLVTNKNLKEAERVAGVAETQIPDEINRSFAGTLSQISALTGGDPNSPAAQAAAGQVLSERFRSLDDAKLGIQQRLSTMKMAIRTQGQQFDVGLLSSIGDTIELLKAQRDADRMARYQLIASAGGNLVGLGLGVAGLASGGGGAAAAPAANRGQTVLWDSGGGY